MKHVAKSVAMLALVAIVAIGCKSGDETTEPASQPAMGAINDVCPVMGGPVDPAAETVSYKGNTIGFCCNGCPSAWVEKTDAEKTAFVSEQKN